MSRFTQYVRQSFSGAAATVALAAGMAVAPAQAQFKSQLPPESCVPFEGAAKRSQHVYDEPLNLLAKKLNAYSGWEEIRTRMKSAGHDFRALCPSRESPPPVAPVPDIKSFVVNILDPSTREPIKPEKFSYLVREGQLDNILDSTIRLANSMSYDSKNNPLMSTDQDLNTRVLLGTVLEAYVTSENIFAAVERAAEEKSNRAINTFYERMPKMVAELSDLHAQAIVAHAQNRSLNEKERTDFRNNILTQLLTAPGARAASASIIGQNMVQVAGLKMLEDVKSKRPVTAPVYKLFNTEDIAHKLQRFPGNPAALDAVKNYKAYWDGQGAQDKDPAAAIEQILKDLPKEIGDKAAEFDKQQGTPPQFNFQLAP